MRHRILTAAVAVAAVFGLGSIAATAAEATASVNVRSGPGTQYGVVDVLRPGQQVDIDRRSGSWCYVIKSGADGWVSCNYLAEGPSRPGPAPTPGRPDVDVGFSFSIPGFSFSVGDSGFDRPRPPRPGFPGRPPFPPPGPGPGFPGPGPGPGFPGPGPGPGGPDSGEVCFYENTNYRGRSFCAEPGERIARLGSWNDRISSIRVRGFAEALVCENDNFRGRCIVVDRNVSNLGPRGNDVISSIRVR